MNHKAIVVELASPLDNGTTIREICPRCGGGSTNEQSLSITKSEDGHVLWQCFRASCTEKGTTNSVGRSSVLPAKKRRVFTGKVEPLSSAHLERIYKLWGIVKPPYWYWTPEHMGRVAMSLRSPKYMHRGWVLRDIYNRSAVKALTYVDEGEEGISWYKTTIGAPTVLVEDVPSAVRASTSGVNAVALCGTGVGATRAEEIAEYATRPVIVALDQDMTAESFKIANRWALLWGDVTVLPLKKDMKDMSEENLKEMLQWQTKHS